jgi:SAM-dependent methyltransferase
MIWFPPTPETQRAEVGIPLRPLSDFYGYDRGTPIDRHYLEGFLHAHSDLVNGRVLEVKDDAYTRRFGADHVRRSTVVDIDPTNQEATLIADLGQPGCLPNEAFDCIICTQTLQFIPNPHLALANLKTALAPGGALLLTVPCLSRISVGLPASDYWRWTPTGLQALLGRLWRGPVTIQGLGNLRACVGFLLGEAAEELPPTMLAVVDPAFPLIACAVARRPQAQHP